MEELVLKYIIAPLLAVIGIIVVGTVITESIGIPGAVATLFGAVGFAAIAMFWKNN